MTQFLVPTSTTLSQRWTAVGDSNHHLTLDEQFLSKDDDTTYSWAVQSNARFRCKLIAPPDGDPDTSGDHRVVIGVRRVNVSVPSPKLLGRLYQGDATTLIASKTWTLGSGTIGTYVGRVLVLNGTQIGNITDYSDLHLDMSISVAPSGGDQVRLTTIELRVPDPAGGNKHFGPFMWNS